MPLDEAVSRAAQIVHTCASRCLDPRSCEQLRRPTAYPTAQSLPLSKLGKNEAKKIAAAKRAELDAEMTEEEGSAC